MRDEPGIPARPAHGEWRSTIAILWRLLVYLRPYRVHVTAACACFLVSAVLALVPGWLTRVAVDRVVLAGETRMLWLIAATMICASALEGATAFLVRCLAEWVGQSAASRMRLQVYHHLTRLSFGYFDRARVGDLTSTVVADVDSVAQFLGFACVHIISNGLLILGVFMVMLVWNVELALVYGILLPFMVHAMTRYAFGLRPVFRRAREALGNMSSALHAEISGVHLVKLYGREDLSQARFDRVSRGLLGQNLAAARISALWMPYVQVLTGLGTGLALWYGGRGVILRGLSPGTLVGFMSYIAMLVRPIRQTGMLVGESMDAMAAAERIFGVLDRESEVRDRPGARSLPPAKGNVVYSHVSFSYDKTAQVIRDVSFAVSEGQTCALVGPTGAGKSTLLHLLPRFYDVDSGSITIDGRDVRDVTLESLRRQVGVVLQHPLLFDASIRDNIAFGRPSASLDEVRRAARAAEIDDFIMALPRGYDTVVGQRGMKLSGGERQRLAIARTILLDPRILILDEPTSSVDAATEARMRRALAALFKGRTVFVIAHRLWTVLDADIILVIRDGRIVQAGTHRDLIDVDGAYRDIYRAEFSGEDVTRGAGARHSFEGES